MRATGQSCRPFSVLLGQSGNVVTNTYNADYQRIKQEDNTGTRKYFWDEENLLHQLDEFDDVELDYHYEHQLYGILLQTYDHAAAQVQYALTYKPPF